MSGQRRHVPNTSAVARPKWTGGQGDMAVAVSRGEPRRSNAQMADAVREQVRAYLEEFPPRTPGPAPIAPAVIEALTERLAVELVRPDVTQVLMSREHLLLYVGTEIERYLARTR